MAVAGLISKERCTCPFLKFIKLVAGCELQVDFRKRKVHLSLPEFAKAGSQKRKIFDERRSLPFINFCKRCRVRVADRFSDDEECILFLPEFAKSQKSARQKPYLNKLLKSPGHFLP
jgi:hypothetical protein